MDTKLLDEVAKIIAKACNMYTESRIEHERFISAAVEVVTVVTVVTQSQSKS